MKSERILDVGGGANPRNPSYDEAGPTTVLESLACGTPTVCTDRLPFREYSLNGNSLFFTASNYQHLAGKIIESVNNYSKLKRNALKTADFYTSDRVAEEVLKVYRDGKELLGGLDNG